MNEGFCLCEMKEELGEEDAVKGADITKQPVLSLVAMAPPPSPDNFSRAERVTNYVQSYRIHELMNFIMAQLLANMPEHPLVFITNLLDSCMLCRAGLGAPPILYDDRHVKQLIKSFDPGDRGWLSSAQVYRARETLGLPTCSLKTSHNDEQVSTKLLQETLCSELNEHLYDLLCAGVEYQDEQTIQSDG